MVGTGYIVEAFGEKNELKIAIRRLKTAVSLFTPQGGRGGACGR